MDKTSLTFQALKNSTYNVLGYFWPILFTFLVTPVIIFSLGIKEYGIYLFINTVIGFVGLLDLGLGTAVTKHMSFYFGRKDDAAVTRLIRSANSLFAIGAFVGLGVALLIAFAGPDLLPDRFASYEQYASLFIIGGAIFFLNTIGSTATAAIVAVQRFDVYNKINAFSATAISLSMLAAVKMGGDLTDVFLCQLAIAAVVSLVTFWYAKRLLKRPIFGFGWDAAEVKHCYAFGLVNFVNNIGTSTLASLDRLIIPLFIGPSNLTYYSMPGNVGNKIPGMSNTLSASFLPTVSHLSGGQELVRIQTFYVRSFRLITVIAGALTVTTIAFAHDILFHWLDADFAARSSGILVVLALTNFILALYNPLANFLLGMGKLRFLTFSSIGMSLLDLALLFVLLPRFGLFGAALAYLISVLPVAYFFYHVERHYLGLSDRKAHYAKAVFGTLAVSALVWAIDLFLGRFIVGLPSLLLVGGASATIYVILYRLLGFFEPEDWQDLERFYRAVLQRFRIIK